MKFLQRKPAATRRQARTGAEFTRVAMTGPPPTSGSPQVTPKRLLKSVGIPVLAGVVGMVLGASTGAAGAQTELTELRVAEEALTDNVATLTAAHSSTTEELDAVSAERDEAAAAIAKGESEVRELKSQLTKLQEQVRGLEEAAVKAAAEAEAAVQAAAAQPVPFAAPPASPPESAAPAPAPAPAVATQFENCTAARAAGAAPVWAGDPGYGRHLDRDGDGVGCE